MKKIFLHLGFPKCASKFLEYRLYPEMKNYRILSNGSGNRIFKSLFSMFRGDFDFDIDNTGKEINRIINGFQEDNIIISSERFIGNFYDNFASRDKIFEVLARWFPEAKVLLLTREQSDFVDSLYTAYIRAGGERNIDAFAAVKKYSCYDHCFSIDKLDYYEIYCNLSDLFGTDMVHMIPYELLRENYDVFLREVLNFFEYDKEISVKNTRVNKRSHKCSLVIKRTINKILYSKYNRKGILPKTFFNRFTFFGLNSKNNHNSSIYSFLDKIFNLVFPGVKVSFLSNYKKKVIKKKHEANNLKLEKIMQKDISSYGYY